MNSKRQPFHSACIATLLILAITAPLEAASVRDFGAVGDGAADDTAAIERAVRETPDGLVEFPRGNYRITRTIEIDLTTAGPLSLDGLNGVGRVTMAGPGPAFRFAGSHTGTASPTGFKPEVWQAERMPQVEGLEIVGAHEEADGIEFSQVMQPTLRGVSIREVRDGVRLATRNRNLLVDGCHIYNNTGAGVFFDHVNLHQAIIVGSHISYNKRGGIKIVGGEIRNFHITGNDIEYNYDLDAEESADIWFDLREGTVAEGTIASNTIQAVPSPGGANIRFVGPERPEQRGLMGLWTISGNLIGNQTTNIHLVHCRAMAITGNHIYSGVDRTLVVERSRHIVVGQNSLDQSHNFGREFTNGVTIRDCDGVVLSGLILDRAASGSAEAGGAVEVFNSRETSITGCQIFEPRFRGIYVADSRNTRIADNTVMHRPGSPSTNALHAGASKQAGGAKAEGEAEEGGEAGEGGEANQPSAATMLAAIAVAGASRNAVITGNLIGEGSEDAIVVAPGTAIIGENYPVAGPGDAVSDDPVQGDPVQGDPVQGDAAPPRP